LDLGYKRLSFFNLGLLCVGLTSEVRPTQSIPLGWSLKGQRSNTHSSLLGAKAQYPASPVMNDFDLDLIAR
jgi:hypothetical protein